MSTRTITTVLLLFYLFTLKVAHDTDLVLTTMDKKEFINQLPFVLGELYANGVKGKQPSSFVFSMFERFAEAHAQGAVFFGPVAVVPQNDEHTQWIIKDLRGGWGYYPINLYIDTDPGVEPTLETIHKKLVRHTQSLRSEADDVEKLANELCK